MTSTSTTISVTPIKRSALSMLWALMMGAMVAEGYAGESTAEKPVVNLYLWADMIPRSILQAFEKESGIHVVYDTYDSNDMLEAKLLTNHAAYDLVCPTLFPYVEAQIEAGAYRPFAKDWMRRLPAVMPEIAAMVRQADPKGHHIIPYVWGVTGFAYNQAAWEERAAQLPKEVNPTSLRFLWDPEIVKVFDDCGVSLLDEAVDVFPSVLLYQGRNPNSDSTDDLAKAARQVQRVRPFVTRFGMYQSSRELASGELCLVQGWASDLAKARDVAAHASPAVSLRVVVPHEGSSLWVDGFGIPKTAPHPKNAERFLRFILRPENAAVISEHMGVATVFSEAARRVEKRLRQDPVIYPNLQSRSFFVDRRMPQSYVQARSRYWLRIRAGLGIDDPVPPSSDIAAAVSDAAAVPFGQEHPHPQSSPQRQGVL